MTELKKIHLCKEGWRLYDVMCSKKLHLERRKATFNYLVHRKKCDECIPAKLMYVGDYVEDTYKV